MYAYNLGYRSGMYTYDDYRPEFSDNRVNVQYIQALLQDLNSNDFIVKKGRWNWQTYILALPFIATVVTCIIIATNMKSSSTEFDSNLKSIEVYKSGYIDSQAGTISILLCILVGLACLAGTFWVATKEESKFTDVRQGFLDIILNKHQQEVFSHLNCTLKLSPYTAYVIVEFDWRKQHLAVGQVVPYSDQSDPRLNQVYPRGGPVMSV